MRLAISRRRAAASGLQASGCFGSSESVRVSKEMRIIGKVVLILNWWNARQPGRFASQSCMPPRPEPPTRKRRRAGPSPSSLQPDKLRSQAPRQKLPNARFITNKKGNIQRMKPCHVANAGWPCQGRGPGCSRAKLGREALYSARGGAPETNRSVQTSSSVESHPSRSRRIRGCAAPEDWSAPGRQEFVGAFGGSRAGTPKERREITVLIR